MDNDPTIPLLRAHLRPSAPPFKLSALQRTAIYFFCSARFLRGLFLIAWPSLSLSSFDIPEQPGGATGPTFILGSLLGSRDLLLGALLWTADQQSRRETSRALLFNLLSDSADTFILIFSAACAWHWRNPLVEIVMVAVLAMLEHLTLYSMSEDDEPGVAERNMAALAGGGAERWAAMGGYYAGTQTMEDKRRRLDAWLNEVGQAGEQMPPQPYKPASTIAADSNV